MQENQYVVVLVDMAQPSIYSTAMALQQHLDGIPQGDPSRSIASTGLGTINKRWNPTLLRAAHASAAYMIDDQLTTESFLYPSLKFGEIILKGMVPRVACIEVSERLVIALPFFGATVLGPVQEIESELVEYELDDCSAVLPLGLRLHRPIFTPVEDVSFVTFAA